MKRIEGDCVEWGSVGAERVLERQSQRGAYRTAKQLADSYQAVKDQENAELQGTAPRGGETETFLTSEYQNEVTERRYEIASWLQEMGTLAETGLTEADVLAASCPAEREETAEDSQKAEAKTQEEQTAENELAGLKRMLESLQRQKKTSTTAVKRTLPYSYQRVSGAIRGAKTVMQAYNAVSRANSSLNQVKRQAATGKYSDKEVSIAKSHARKMVRVARSKLRHMKAENAQKHNGKQIKNHMKQKGNITVSMVHDSEKLQAERKKKQEFYQLSKEIQRKEKQYQNKHRRNENWALLEADMEYLRRRIEYLKNQENVENSDVLSGDYAVGTGDTKIFTESGQSVILEQEGVVETIAEGSEL